MLTRRQFLESGCALAATSGVATLLGNAQADNSARVPPYRALVCIALGGGADSFNMLIPADVSSYEHYIKRRGDLALTANQLLPLPRGDRDGRSYALHHGLRELHALYASGEVALLANTGPLQLPVGHPGSARIPDLSHSSLIARWQHGTANHRLHSGWAGRVADVLGDCNWQHRMPVNISMSGRNIMQLGSHSVAANLQSSPYQQRTDLPDGIDFSYLNQQLLEQVFDTRRPGSGHRKTRRIEEAETECKVVIDDAITNTPGCKTPFPSDPFSKDLEQVARVIAARSRLGAHRQIFFVHFNGWDHHHQLLKSQATLLPTLSRGLAAFRDALIELGVFDNVTTFTNSEFGRSLESNGGGSDHGWGGHHIVMGGSVKGGQLYGHYPHLARGNPLDIGGGSFMPTTSMEEYLAEMVLWLGTPVSDLSYVLPDISKFWSTNSQTPPLGIFT